MTYERTHDVSDAGDPGRFRGLDDHPGGDLPGLSGMAGDRM